MQYRHFLGLLSLFFIITQNVCAAESRSIIIKVTPTPTPVQCPKGTKWNGKVCVPIVPECPLGYAWDFSSASCVCQCPSGASLNAEGNGCVRKLEQDPINPVTVLGMRVGDNSNSYYQNNFALVDVDPFSDQYPGVGLDAVGFGTFFGNTSPLVGTNGVAPLHNVIPWYPTAPYNFLQGRVRYGSGGRTDHYGISEIAIKPSMLASTYRWYGTSVCVDIPSTRKYLLHVGGDNRWDLRVDGASYARCFESQCFKTGLFMIETLQAGLHLFDLRTLDEGTFAAVWFEILGNGTNPQASPNAIQVVTNENQLEKIFSTRNLVSEAAPLVYQPGVSYYDRPIPDRAFIDHSSYAGAACPGGYVYNHNANACGGAGKCVKIERTACGQ